ncbi:malate dehydrogenase, cytoplasmic-like [Quercus lobata]|uniref:malate dehydrogenase, cytoplasmic-like n=1 Tax=Quercus lobata TaxID=97700 RepID=UPI001248C3CE|nr:malate dehydrogenase, cytoplasmic-like [Quercus lobata]
MLGPDQPVILKGVAATTNVVEACKDVNIAVMLGGYPRKEITLRKDMLSTNVSIYKAQTLALEEHAAADCKVLEPHSRRVDKGFSDACVLAEVSLLPEKVRIASGRHAMAMAVGIVDQERPGKKLKQVLVVVTAG